jgi:hypothetical protein
MKPYFWNTLSHTESRDAGSPDAAAIRQYGLASKTGRRSERSCQRSAVKRAVRRMLNKRSRRNLKEIWE